jgi:hypothetical protein
VTMTNNLTAACALSDMSKPHMAKKKKKMA